MFSERRTIRCGGARWRQRINNKPRKSSSNQLSSRLKLKPAAASTALMRSSVASNGWPALQSGATKANQPRANRLIISTFTGRARSFPSPAPIFSWRSICRFHTSRPEFSDKDSGFVLQKVRVAPFGLSLAFSGPKNRWDVHAWPGQTIWRRGKLLANRDDLAIKCGHNVR